MLLMVSKTAYPGLILISHIARRFRLFFRATVKLLSICVFHISQQASPLLLYLFELGRRYPRFPANNLSISQRFTALTTISVCGLIYALRGDDKDPVISVSLVYPSPPIKVFRY